MGTPIFRDTLVRAAVTPNNRFHENENPVPFNKPPNKPIVSIVRKGVLSTSTPLLYYLSILSSLDTTPPFFFSLALRAFSILSAIAFPSLVRRSTLPFAFFFTPLVVVVAAFLLAFSFSFLAASRAFLALSTISLYSVVLLSTFPLAVFLSAIFLLFKRLDHRFMLLFLSLQYFLHTRQIFRLLCRQLRRVLQQKQNSFLFRPMLSHYQLQEHLR